MLYQPRRHSGEGRNPEGQGNALIEATDQIDTASFSMQDLTTRLISDNLTLLTPLTGSPAGSRLSQGSLCFCSGLSSLMRTNFYIDGFNLYFGALARSSPYKWLDLGRLCSRLVPRHEVRRIRYFTARVVDRPDRLGQRQRQNTYLRALRTIPDLSIHQGRFQTHRRRRPLAGPIPGVGRTVEVIETTEKSTDVNLATYLLVDGFQGDYEQAVVVSNDSDLALAIRKVRDVVGLPVGVVNPAPKGPTRMLTESSTFQRHIRATTLSECQFPDTLTDDVGTITKPTEW